jgi:hypothetical protein
MGTGVRTETTSPASWDAFCDVDALVDEVLTELAAIDGGNATDALGTEAGAERCCAGTCQR